VWNGKLIVADTYNHKLKLIDPKAQTSTTFAGTGERGAADGRLADAMFREPSGLSLAGDRLYVADTNNHAIRVVDLKAGTVTTLDVRPAR
jgi:DNA-binding beta-propeller fold protein YncE